MGLGFNWRKGGSGVWVEQCTSFVELISSGVNSTPDELVELGSELCTTAGSGVGIGSV
jgi:hypothetical protein